MKHTLTITRETTELSILCSPRLKDWMFCSDCGLAVRWVLPEEAMALRRTSLRAIFREIEDRRLHCVETADGFLLVCAESLNEEVITSGEIRDEIENHLIAS